MNRIIINITSCVIVVLVSCGCTETNVTDPEPIGVEQGNTELIFQSGFEAETKVFNQKNDDAEITGTDHTLPDLNNWEIDLNGHPKIGHFNIQYQGGNDSQRLAEIAIDPLDPSNSALKFWIKDPNIDNSAGRVQANIYNNDKIKELHYSVHLLISDDFKSVESAPFLVNWLTLMEFWNNANWTTEDYQYRITVNLQKRTARDEHLKIGIKSQVRASGTDEWHIHPVWEHINYSYAVPIGKWMRIDIHFVEGDKTNGRFVFGVTPDGGETTVLHDIRNFTHHPEDPDPDGLSHFNPMKLYTSGKLIDHVKGTDKLLNVYWDDFRLSLAAPQ
ncbi:MAG: hypothetical protein ACR2MT_11160 [Aurantibacter sp.]